MVVRALVVRWWQLATLALALGCEREGREPDEGVGSSSSAARASAPAVVAGSLTANSHEPSLPARELNWEFVDGQLGPMHVVVLTPERRPAQRFPVLITMHGRGEAFKGPRRGARGWLDDYALARAVERVSHPPLTGEDFGAAVEASRLARINARLRRDPYQGLIVVCPYTPDILAGERAFSAAEPLARFLVDELLPRVLAETPAERSSASIGIDGVSLGGRASLLVGFQRPEAFGVVASLQAAIDRREIPRLVELAVRARAKNPKLSIRVLTSQQDYFRHELEALSSSLEAASVEHTFDLVPGDHSYEFNRGPGALEMLTFHNWALRGRPPL